LSQLKEHADEWAGAPTSLFSPHEGRRIAADDEAVGELADLLDHKQLSAEDVKAWGNQLGAFVRGFHGLRKEGRSPSSEFENELKNLVVEISSAHSRMHEESYSIHRLKNRAESLDAGSVALGDALQAFRMESSREAIASEVMNYKDGISALEQRLIESADGDVREEMKDALDQANNELESIQREKRRLEADANATAIARQQSLQALELRKRYSRELPKMERYLVPLTSDGYTQIINGQFLKTAVKGPVSYRMMLNAGLLNEGTQSLSRFFEMITARGNDRDLGAFPPNIPGEGNFHRHFELLLSIQRFVREFGPIMSAPDAGDMRLLAP
jgi:hypothetical protein